MGQLVIYANDSKPAAKGVTEANCDSWEVSSGHSGSSHLPPASQLYRLRSQSRLTDDAYRTKLDEDTALRRRVYEMLLVSACPRVGQLDGLNVDRHAIVKKDAMWSRLVDLGVLKEQVVN